MEFHHLRPFAEGGGKGVDGIELRCRAHNGYESKVFLGARKSFQNVFEAWVESTPGGGAGNVSETT